MGGKGVLLFGFLAMAAVVSLTAAIIAAAPAIAVTVVVVGIGLFLYWIDYPNDNDKKPP